MKYLSIDIETTGLDEKNCQVLSIAGVLEDTLATDIPVEELRHFHFIFNHKHIKGEPFALNMNKDIIEIIKEGKDSRLIDEGAFTTSLQIFLLENGIKDRKLKVAGKNFATFDKKFIEKILFWDTTRELDFHQRILDVAPLFVDFKNDEWLPNLNTCMQRAGIEGSVTHDALEDARDVIRVLRTKY